MPGIAVATVLGFLVLVALGAILRNPHSLLICGGLLLGCLLHSPIAPLGALVAVCFLFRRVELIAVSPSGGSAAVVDTLPNVEPDPVPEPTGYHDVRGYYRTIADGETQWVRPHVRSNPDGILRNNLNQRAVQK